MPSVNTGSTSLLALGSVQVLSLPNNRIQVRHYRKKCGPVSDPPQAPTRRAASIADHSDEALAQLEAEGDRMRDECEGSPARFERFSLCQLACEGTQPVELRLADAPLSSDLLLPEELIPPPLTVRGRIVEYWLAWAARISRRGTVLIPSVGWFKHELGRMESRVVATTFLANRCRFLIDTVLERGGSIRSRLRAWRSRSTPWLANWKRTTRILLDRQGDRVHRDSTHLFSRIGARPVLAAIDRIAAASTGFLRHGMKAGLQRFSILRDRRRAEPPASAPRVGGGVENE